MFDNSKIYIALFLFIALSIAFYCYKIKIDTLSGDLAATVMKLQDAQTAIATQNQAVQELSIKSMEEVKRANESEKQAQEMLIIKNKSIAKLLAEDIPQDCVGAMHWGLNKALEMGRGE